MPSPPPPPTASSPAEVANQPSPWCVLERKICGSAFYTNFTGVCVCNYIVSFTRKEGGGGGERKREREGGRGREEERGREGGKKEKGM